MINLVCIIPARGGSRGIPQKNTREVGGKPLLAWSVERALSSKYVKDNVYVSSDDEQILNLAEKLGAHSIKRPKEISGDQASSESALVHAYEIIARQSLTKIDYIVFLQATSPLRRVSDIDSAIELLLESNGDSLLSCQPLKDHFIWHKKKQGFEPQNHDYKSRRRRQDIETTYLENGSIYIFRPEILLGTKNRLGGKIIIYEMDRIHSLQIDDLEELGLCDYFLKKLYTGKDE